MTSETKKSANSGEILKLAGILFAITAIVACLLGVVNMVTAPMIEKNKAGSLQVALSTLIPDAEFETLSVDAALDTYAATPATVKNVYKASGDKGYCVEVAPTGFGGAISIIVGINPGGTVAGIQILSMAETPGLGAKASEPDFADQFIGGAADGSMAVSNDGGTINAITGATITSRAVTNGVNAACTYVANMG